MTNAKLRADVATLTQALAEAQARIDELTARAETAERVLLERVAREGTRGLAGNRCEYGNECGRTGCEECQP